MPNVSQAPEDQPRRQGKYFTLAVLLVWVAGVFVYTVLKFSKVIP